MGGSIFITKVIRLGQKKIRTRSRNGVEILRII